MNKDQIILQLQQGNKKVLKEVYVSYRTEFLKFASKFSVSTNDVLDCYQDAIIVLQEQALKGKLNDLQSSVKTYLFSIGKHMLYAKARKNNKTVLYTVTNEEVTELVHDFNKEPTELQTQLKVGLEKLGKKCKEVLHLFYYRGFTIDEIAEHLQYENKNVVKSQKSRCLKQLKQKINEH